MNHILIAGHGYIGKVHQFVSPLPAHFLVRHIPEEDGIFYTDFKEAIDTNPLFLDICTPNDSHPDLVKKAVDAALPIYCEKPLAPSYEEAKQMADHVKKKNLYNGVAFNYRFLPCVHLLKQILSEGRLGKIIYYKASFLHDSYVLPRPKVWRTTAAAGGGALADLGIHLFDLCNYIFGQNILTACEKHIEFPERTEVDEYARCTIESEIAKGYLEISRISSGRSNENGIEVFAHNGSARIIFDRPYELEFYDIRSKETTVITADANLLTRTAFPDKKHDMGMFYGSHKAAIESFINGLISGTKSEILADFDDALCAQKILHDALNT